MKILLILLLILTGCSVICPKPPEPKKSFLEKVNEEDKNYVRAKIDKMDHLTDGEKFLYKEFNVCIRDAVPNQQTIEYLMDWQTRLIFKSAEIYCFKYIENMYGGTAELLRALNR